MLSAATKLHLSTGRIGNREGQRWVETLSESNDRIITIIGVIIIVLHCHHHNYYHCFINAITCKSLFYAGDHVAHNLPHKLPFLPPHFSPGPVSVWPHPHLAQMLPSQRSLGPMLPTQNFVCHNPPGNCPSLQVPSWLDRLTWARWGVLKLPPS